MKYRRFYAKIDLDAIENNVKKVREKIGDGVKLLAVVKADAYGHGAVVIAESVRDYVDYYGVADVAEALELRRRGCRKPILVLGFVNPEEYKTVVENAIDIAVLNYTDAEKLSEEASKQGKKAIAHIKVDTGMSRLGFDTTDESVSCISKISHLPNIELKGVFSHFANADMPDGSSAIAQNMLFDEFLEKLSKSGVEFELRHINNSAGIMRFDDCKDMVRMGIIMYGYYPSEDMKNLSDMTLTPALELRSHVSCVKTLEAGRGVSYGHTYVTTKPTKVATVPVGYADGYPRSLSGKADVIIGGKRCPVIGRVCMDQLMADVSEVPDVNEGDDVVIVGKTGDCEITVEEIAELAGSFNYEFICGIGRRVPRVYYKNGEYMCTVSYLD